MIPVSLEIIQRTISTANRTTMIRSTVRVGTPDASTAAFAAVAAASLVLSLLTSFRFGRVVFRSDRPLLFDPGRSACEIQLRMYQESNDGPPLPIKIAHLHYRATAIRVDLRSSLSYQTEDL